MMLNQQDAPAIQLVRVNNPHKDLCRANENSASSATSENSCIPDGEHILKQMRSTRNQELTVSPSVELIKLRQMAENWGFC